MTSEETTIVRAQKGVSQINAMGLVRGKIESTSDNIIRGWLYSPTRPVTPVLYVQKRVAKLITSTEKRIDVQKAIGTTASTGFRFEVDGMRQGDEIQLYSLAEGKLTLVDSTTAPHSIVEQNPIRQLEAIRQISLLEDSVAITSWDGAHNPIGRAKVLYDILDSNRPVVLVTYISEDFGGQLWAPLANSNIHILSIPWLKRDLYHRLIQQLGIKFSTIWICKPRMPNFQLAAQLADGDAKIILDLDDNDHHFSMSIPSRTKIHGLPGLNSSKRMVESVASRTVASKTLQQEFGGNIVRHARKENNQPKALSDIGDRKNIGFIGTVRPHKNILAAAKSIKYLNWALNKNLQFHVYGDIQPESLKKELIDHGVHVRGVVAEGNLQEALASMDVILTGFPSSGIEDSEVTRFQITSKIGDGLNAGRPVLVPLSPSVADLEDVPGVYLFKEEDFIASMMAALESRVSISLPSEFSLSSAYDTFVRSEQSAVGSPRANSVFNELVVGQVTDEWPSLVPTLLLIWKQNDAGVYGRRIDQIARAYKRSNPAHNVVVLELLHTRQRENYTARSKNYLSDSHNVLKYSDEKIDGRFHDADGIVYDVIEFKSSDALGEHISDYLMNRSFMPTNTTVVLFPVIRFMESFISVIESYAKVIDVVDNHFSWASKNEEHFRGLFLQYSLLFRGARKVIFNSSENFAHFSGSGLLDGISADIEVIPNWYEKPKLHLETARTIERTSFNVVYSGNMNDRVNWKLIEQLSLRVPGISIHLVGSAERAGEGFFTALGLDNVYYHGPQTEDYSIRLLSRANLAIMPHLSDNVSSYMNPLKLHMYASFLVPTVSSAVEGIDRSSKTLTVLEDDFSFIEHIENIYNKWSARQNPIIPSQKCHKEAPIGPDTVKSMDGRKYVALLSQAFAGFSESRV